MVQKRQGQSEAVTIATVDSHMQLKTLISG